MLLTEVIRVLDALERAEVPAWLEGGWGIDALVGEQTRSHRDVDLDVEAVHEAAVLDVLGSLGYRMQTDQRPTRVELVAEGRGWVDLHPLRFLPDGHAEQAAPDGSVWRFEPAWFSRGRLGDREVLCFTAEAQRVFHSGYEMREVDRLDLERLDRHALEEAAGASEGRPGTPSRIARS